MKYEPKPETRRIISRLRPKLKDVIDHAYCWAAPEHTALVKKRMLDWLAREIDKLVK